MPKKKLYKSDAIVYSTDPNFTAGQEPEDSVTMPPEEQVLRVRIDAKHRGGKMVTLVENFSGSDGDLQKLGKELKSYCATGGSAKDNEIIIQGDNREKVFQWLLKKGYKKTKKI